MRRGTPALGVITWNCNVFVIQPYRCFQIPVDCFSPWDIFRKFLEIDQFLILNESLVLVFLVADSICSGELIPNGFYKIYKKICYCSTSCVSVKDQVLELNVLNMKNPQYYICSCEFTNFTFFKCLVNEVDLIMCEWFLEKL